MPFVNIRTIKGAMTGAQKKQLQERVTDLLVEIEGRGNPAFRRFVWVMLEEEAAEHWMLGGQPVSLEKLVALGG